MKKVYILVITLMLFSLISIFPVYADGDKPSNIYVVKAGDTLWKIADKYGTTIEELKLTNGRQTDSLLVGERLWVPITYYVVAGDTLWEIAKANNSTVQLIKTANGLSSDLIYIGQKLKLPVKRMIMKGQYILMSREEFRDWLAHHKFLRKITIVQEHHTWSPSYSQFNGSNYFQLIKGMEDYHVKERGFITIAQNLTTFPDGKIAVCRPFDVAPEGSIGSYANSLGLNIENVGNFDVGFDVMTEEQKETVVYITALLCIKFGLTPSIDNVTYHHWWDMNTGERVLDNSTGHVIKTCPGTGFFGGNSTDSAIHNFYPLVLRKIEQVLKSAP